MTANEADDIISELGTAEVARRYGFDHGPRPYGPPGIERARRDGENHAIAQRVNEQIERSFGRRG